MALIGKIREKSGLLVVIIGLALIAFILPEFTKSNVADNVVGYVSGEKVKPELYDQRLTEISVMDQQQAQQSQREYTAQDQENSMDKAWNSIVEEMIFEKEFKALGIEVSDKELDAYLYGTDGFTVMENLRTTFVNEKGEFDKRLLEQRIQQMESSKNADEVNQWKKNKEDLKKQRRSEKYFQLVSQGVYVTKLEAKQEYIAQKERKSISFIAKRYSEIPDDQIKVTDDAVRKFYDEHKNEKKWESTAGRSVKYFEINVTPSKADIKKFDQEIASLKDGFAKSKNDSLYVLANSELRMYNSTHQATFMPEGDPKATQGLTYAPYMDTVFKTAQIGQIVGPYTEGQSTRIAKVLDFNRYVLSARHILVGLEVRDANGQVVKTRTEQEAQKVADSLVKLVNKDNFAQYVLSSSDDMGSKNTGGVYDDFMDFKMVPEFSKFVTDKPVGTIGTVKTQFGIHIIEVTGKKEVKYPVLAIIQKTLVPSEETESAARDEAYDVLNSFDAKISAKKTVKEKLDLFDTLARKKDYFVTQPIQIMDESPRVNAFGSTTAKDRILKLAYDESSEVGTLCSTPIKDGSKYIIAIVSSIREKGVPNFEDVESQMRAEVIKDLKAKRFIRLMMGSKTVEAAAKKLNMTVEAGEVTFANPQFQASGFEPEVVGSLFANLKDGQTTIPLKGEQGVYLIRLNKTTKAPAAANYDAERMQLLNASRGNVQNGIRQALYKKAEVRDNRKFRSLGIAID